jgi:hypothetical protein
VNPATDPCTPLCVTCIVAGRQVDGVRFVTAPRIEPYGQVAVFLDVAGDRWDLLGPA